MPAKFNIYAYIIRIGYICVCVSEWHMFIMFIKNLDRYKSMLWLEDACLRDHAIKHYTHTHKPFFFFNVLHATHAENCGAGAAVRGVYIPTDDIRVSCVQHSTRAGTSTRIRIPCLQSNLIRDLYITKRRGRSKQRNFREQSMAQWSERRATTKYIEGAALARRDCESDPPAKGQRARNRTKCQDNRVAVFKCYTNDAIT